MWKPPPAPPPRHLAPSSSTAGFFQTPPRLENQMREDVAFKRVVDLFLPPQFNPLAHEISTDLLRFGDLVLTPEVLSWVADAESHPPAHHPHDTFGHRIDNLSTSTGWKQQLALAAREGIIAIGYEPHWGASARTYQFLKMALWAPSSALATCPIGMSDGAAVVMKRRGNLGEGMGSRVFERLTSRDMGRVWWSGQWMTERKGGSDVRGTETVAELVGSPNSSSVCAGEGPWSISGFKWFTSAVDADMSILLAQTTGGLSAFYAPMRRTSGELNGVRVQRLKNKLGTKPVPTAELVLNRMKGFLIGNEGEGVKEIAHVLNMTRIHNAVTAMGTLGRGLAIAKAYAKVRKVAGGTPLKDVKAHVRSLATDWVDYWGNLFLTFWVVGLLGRSEHPQSESSLDPLLPEDPKAVHLLLRLMTPMVKATTALAAIKGLRSCMEHLGGIGYLEDVQDQRFNVARLFRDVCVLSIWEGTTDVMADDLVRVLKGSQGTPVLEAVKTWLESMTKGAMPASSSDGRWKPEIEILKTSLQTLKNTVKTKEREELKWMGREIMEESSWIIIGTLLVFDAARDNNSVAEEVAKRWIFKGTRLAGQAEGHWSHVAEWDKRIVFGFESSREMSKL
ncbi:MAG: hypothetical protein M1834_002335 [Cirrosporium novae-zelandiae]|nr:MAG: hypothetical protein M1834_002335 [Cirrosporium novae-zelandiae]